MALTRNFLKSLNIEAEVIDSIINAHTETVNAIKEDKESLEKKFKGVDLEDLQAKAGKYEEISRQLTTTKEEYANYKAEVVKSAERQSKVAKVTELLKANKANDMAIPLMLKAINIDELKLNKEGNIENSPIDSLKAEYGAFFTEPTTQTQGVNTPTPPAGPNTQPEDMFLKGLNG